MPRPIHDSNVKFLYLDAQLKNVERLKQKKGKYEDIRTIKAIIRTVISKDG